MYTLIEKSKENKTRVLENSTCRIQSRKTPVFQFSDKRTETIARRKPQEMVRNTPRQMRSKSQHEMANNYNQQLSGVIQRQISDAAYNQARDMLIAAGSASANAAHVKHTGGAGSPDGHGRQLVSEAIQEFRQADAGGQVLTRGMTMAHFVAVSNAATGVGLNVENIFTWMGL